ncbi:MAG: hypothetical protein LKJ86_08165 [Oscillibacter sp.]|jgi:hypothetical protein|nr:hypothetical protein [Oscillibacter sp.]
MDNQICGTPYFREMERRAELESDLKRERETWEKEIASQCGSVNSPDGEDFEHFLCKRIKNGEIRAEEQLRLQKTMLKKCRISRNIFAALCAVLFLVSSAAMTSRFEAKQPDVSIKNFVASRDGVRYHCLDCPYVDKITAENVIYYQSYNDAKADGYTPCTRCNPQS